MRQRSTIAVTATAVFLALACTACGTNHQSFVSKPEGVSISYPTAWQLTTHNDSYVPDPALCLDLKPKVDPRIDLRVVEYLPPYFDPRYLRTYQPRPARFHLNTFRPADEDWSPPRAGVIQFRDHGRVFMVSLTRPKKPGQALTRTVEHILDSLTTTGGRCRPSSGIGSTGVPKP
jgi:hypothetical protein